MEVVEPIDYAKALMDAQNNLKQMHLNMLLKKYDLALEHAIQAIADTKMAYNAILYEKDVMNRG
jgi:hypothetical protein